MREYLKLLSDILANGVEKENRTGINASSVFGRQLRFNLRKGFPLLTTKKVNFKAVAYELLWFLSGSTNIKYLQDHGIHIWDAWANKRGELGPVYGRQWRNFGGINYGAADQIQAVQSSLRNDPYSRRHIVTAWNPIEIHNAALPPCHLMFQFDVRKVNGETRLSCMMTMRSCDVFLGLPFNIASYALLTHMMAQTTGHKVGELIINLGDAHLYENHFEQAAIQIQREPLPLPGISLDGFVKDIDGFEYENINLVDYKAHGALKAEIAV